MNYDNGIDGEEKEWTPRLARNERIEDKEALAGAQEADSEEGS